MQEDPEQAFDAWTKENYKIYSSEEVKIETIRKIWLLLLASGDKVAHAKSAALL